MVSQRAFLPLLAQTVIPAGLLGIVAIAILLPQRRAEADAYARAPVCADGMEDGCRSFAEVTVVSIDCPPGGWNLDACDLVVGVDDASTHLPLPRQAVDSISVGTQLRAERFDGILTGAEINDLFVPRSGSPEEAMRTMRQATGGIVVAECAAAGYLFWRKRRTP